MGTPSTDRSTVPDVAGRDIPTVRRMQPQDHLDVAPRRRPDWTAPPWKPPSSPDFVWHNAVTPEEVEGRWASEVVEDSGNPKDAVGDTKPQMWLVPAVLNVEVARVMADGARKYGPYNWRTKPVKMTVYLSAIERHELALKDGEDLTRDSKVKHLAAIAASCAILLDAEATGNLIDDRPTPGPAADLIDEYTEKKAA